MNKRNKIIYNVVTGLFAVHTLFTIVVYVFMNDMAKEMFLSLGVPASIIYPLAIAKLLGVVAIVSNKSKILKELAYLGFALDYVMASFFHLSAGDESWFPPLVVLVVLGVSYYFHRRLRAENTK